MLGVAAMAVTAVILTVLTHCFHLPSFMQAERLSWCAIGTGEMMLQRQLLFTIITGVTLFAYDLDHMGLFCAQTSWVGNQRGYAKKDSLHQFLQPKTIHDFNPLPIKVHYALVL